MGTEFPLQTLFLPGKPILLTACELHTSWCSTSSNFLPDVFSNVVSKEKVAISYTVQYLYVEFFHASER